ncbi:hypothetical protein UFOVP115_57 [uncultured Caudovirales phage]|uniref:Uncharacterized protein n=1 Tax=uncultured Caudovirales phage TaxID=2100421 RepID=A0A6J5L982_9CAUD|nr:hypothetical protein UFOVP115_57 [uncultured Caudovirales phage]
MSAEDFIEDMFGELEAFYPGSKRKRREPAPKVELDTSWEKDFYKKTLPNGRQLEVYTLGSLAQALNRPIATLRQWMDRKKFPDSPYRLPSKPDKNGKIVEGRRLYSRAMVDVTIELFAKAGLLGTDRIDWTLHQRLTSKIAEAWETIRAEENKTTN